MNVKSISESHNTQQQSEETYKIFTVTVISGKGGVGKTSITSSLAYVLAQQNRQIIVADADVDAPNLAILFTPENSYNNIEHSEILEKSRETHKQTVQTSEKAEFIPEKCTHCKQCIDQEFCSFDALSWDENKKIPIIDVVACEGCKACQLLCPSHSFQINPVNSGTITTIMTDYGFPLISGETILGSQTSGKMVTELRKIAEVQAKQENRDFLLMDGPPGIGCPVLAAITGVDFIVFVTEPTTAALHDINRAISIVKSFNIPFGIIINKKDMNLEMYSELTAFFKQKGYEILGSFPINSRWPYAIVSQEPIAKFLEDQEILQEFEAIAEKLWNKRENCKEIIEN
ncbi:MAG: ATP-binding protein [Candidatus Lokiarchaeota archaeon]|nr:ATP-binding protein [Candidatus Harpocratesius repetitus]